MRFQRRQRFNRTLCLGLVFLVLANLTRVVLERHGSMPEGLRDAVVGFLFGLAIGCMLLGVWRMSHPTGPSDKPSCA